MAKQNGNRAADYDRELEELEKKIRYKRRKKIIESSFKEGLVLLKKYPGHISGKQNYPDSAVIHPKTGAIFDSRVFSPKEVDELFFKIESMCHQIKTFCPEMSESKKEELISLMENLDTIRSDLAPYYNSMVKYLADEKSPKKQRNDRQVGNIGITASMLSGR